MWYHLTPQLPTHQRYPNVSKITLPSDAIAITVLDKCFQNYLVLPNDFEHVSAAHTILFKMADEM